MTLSLPFALTNGQTADANQVMANLNAIVSFINGGGLATSGANFNITSLSGLTTPLSIPQGGTGAVTGAAAISNLGGVRAANNGTDFSSPATTLTNLGGLAKASNLSDVANVATARNNLLPAQAGNTGLFLKTDGTNASWAAASLFYAQFQEQQASGVNSSLSLSSGAWTKRTITTTVTNTIPGCSVTSSQITLPAGTYVVTATGNVVESGGTSFFGKHRLRNITAGATIASGPGLAASSGQYMAPSLSATFVLAAPAVIELDTWGVQVGGGTLNGGLAFGTGDPEVYTDITIIKIG